MKKKNVTNASTNRISPLPFILYFFSGFAALVAEIAVMRRAGLVFGVSSWAMATVLAVFFGGMAVGSFLGGRWLLRFRRPLLVYGLIEIAAAVGMVLVVVLFPAAAAIQQALYGTFFLHFHLLVLFRMLLTGAILAVPVLCMGMTFPVISRFAAADENRLLPGVSLLYLLNTLGAGIGALVCGLFLIPHAGITAAICFSGAIFLAVGIVAILDNRKQQPDDTVLFVKTPSCTSPVLMIAYAVAGFAALGGEVLWARFLSLVIHNTVYTAVFSISAVLFGGALGSLLVWRTENRIRDCALWYGAALGVSGCAMLAALAIPPAVFSALIDTSSLLQQGLLSCGLMLLPAIASGFAYPLGIRCAARDSRDMPLQVGRLGAANIAGGVAGSLAAGFLLIPFAGLQGSFWLLSGLLVVTGSVVVLFLSTAKRPVKAGLTAGVLLCGALLIAGGTVRIPEEYLAHGRSILACEQGAHSFLAVVKQDGYDILSIDRMWQGESRRTRQVVAAHVPAILHGDPENVCVVGLGVGQTAGRFLMHDIKRLDCIEIEQELPGFIQKHFGADWLKDPRVHVVVEDGRNWLRNTPERYDIISVEVGQTFRPGVAGFYTREFYRDAKDRLAAGGLICQFLPVAAFDTVTFRSAVATFVSVFPQSALWYNTGELLLIGSADRPVAITGDALSARLAHPSIIEDLSFSYWGGRLHWLARPEVFAAGFIGSGVALSRIAGSSPLFYDDRPVLEYRTAHSPENEPAMALLRSACEPFDRVISAGLPPVAVEEMNIIRNSNIGDIIAQGLLLADRERPASALLEAAVAANPLNIAANARLLEEYLSAGRYRDAVQAIYRIRATDPDNAVALNNLGTIYMKSGAPEMAEPVFREVIRLSPDYAVALNNLGSVLAMKGDLVEALSFFERSVAADPSRVSARENLERARAALAEK